MTGLTELAGTVANDDIDDQPAFTKACAQAARDGRAVILNEGNSWSGEAEAPVSAQWTVYQPAGYATPSEFGSDIKTVIYRLLKYPKWRGPKSGLQKS